MYIYGLDFGTSNSALSIYNTASHQIEKTFTAASVLYFPQPKNAREPIQHFVGKEAIERYVSNALEGRLMKSLKSVLPHTSFTHTFVFNKKYTAETLVALILSHLKAKADAFVGAEVDRVILGRPVVFDEKRAKDQLAQDRIRKAAKIAGFKDIYFQFEPIAAAFTYERKIQKKEMVLVADFGGGTSDFTLMQLDPQKSKEANRKEDMLAKGGVHIGGDDFDARIMWHQLVPYFGYGLQYQSYNKKLDLPLHYFKNICSWEKMNFFKGRKIKSDLEYYHYATGYHEAVARLMTLVGNNLGYALFRAIEKAKIGLSELEEVVIAYQQDNIDLHENMTIDAFNSFINKDITKIDRYLTDFLAAKNIADQHIDTVFITGGSSMVRAIKGLLEKRFGTGAIQSGDNFNSVVNGLAYSSALFLR